MKHLEERRKQETKETLNSTNVVGDMYDNEDDVYFVIADENIYDFWILDSRCSFHICPHKEWFDSYKSCDAGTLLMPNDSSIKAVGISTVKVKMFDGVVRKLTNVRHVLHLKTLWVMSII